MTNQQIIAGLDIGTAWVRLAVCKPRNEDNIPQVLTLIKKPARGLRRGYVINPDETTEAVRNAVTEAERGLKTKIRKVVLGLGGVSLDSRVASGIITTNRPETEISSADINKVIDIAEANLPEMLNRQVLHRLPLSYKIDGEKVLGHPEGLRGSRLEAQVLFVTGLSQHIKDLVMVAENAGLLVEDVIASPLAASAVVMSKLQKTAGSVLVNIGSQTTSIAVFEEGLPVSIQVFPIGSMDITNDIALGFRIPIEEAEKVKRGEGEPVGTKKKLDEIIEARLSDIFEFIETHLRKLGRNGLLPAGLIITGGGSSIPNIEELAKNYFRLPAQIAASTIAASSRSQIRDVAWSVSYGLCAYYLEDNSTESVGLKFIKNTGYRLWGILRELMP